MIEAQETTGERRVLFCDKCGAQHIDEGWYGSHPHEKHLCQHCNQKFSVGAKTIGVAEPTLVDMLFKNVHFCVLEVSCQLILGMPFLVDHSVVMNPRESALYVPEIGGDQLKIPLEAVTKEEVNK